MSVHRERGFTLPEVLTAVAVIGFVLLCSVPAFSAMRRRAAVRSAAAELRAIFHLVRSRALARSTNAGVKFADVRGEWTYAIYDDGDRDGIRNEDIRSGVDRVFVGSRALWQQPQLVRIELPPSGIKDPDGDPFPPDALPVQFNRSTICSFSELGKATPGTIYLRDAGGLSYAVRVYGPTAKIRVLRYDAGSRKWVAR